MLEIVNPWAVPNLLAGLAGTVVALVVFLRRPGAIQNRAVASFVWLTGLGWAVFYGPGAFGIYLHGASFKTGYLAWTLALLAYLWLLSTLDSPLAWPLAKRAVRMAYTVGFLGLAVAVALTPLISWHSLSLRVDATLLFDAGWTAIVLLGMFVALSAWKRVPEGPLRRRNAAFAFGLAVHGVSTALYLGVTWTLAYLYPWLGVGLGQWAMAIPGVAVLVVQGILLYGVLGAVGRREADGEPGRGSETPERGEHRPQDPGLTTALVVVPPAPLGSPAAGPAQTKPGK